MNVTIGLGGLGGTATTSPTLDPMMGGDGTAGGSSSISTCTAAGGQPGLAGIASVSASSGVYAGGGASGSTTVGGNGQMINGCPNPQPVCWFSVAGGGGGGASVSAAGSTATGGVGGSGGTGIAPIGGLFTGNTVTYGGGGGGGGQGSGAPTNRGIGGAGGGGHGADGTLASVPPQRPAAAGLANTGGGGGGGMSSANSATSFALPGADGGTGVVILRIPMPASPVVAPALPPAVAPLVTAPVVTAPPTTQAPTTTAPTPSTTVPSTDVPVPARGTDGQLPALEPGAAVVTENGVPVQVERLVENDTDLVVRSADFELRLKALCDAGCSVVTTADGFETVQLEQEGDARVSGFGFLPGSTVHVWVFSEPIYLGALTVAADGTYEGILALTGIEVGSHTLQANGLSFDGAERSTNMGIVVAEAPALPSTDDVLPATGTGSSQVMLWAALAVMAGLTLVVRRPAGAGRVPRGR